MFDSWTCHPLQVAFMNSFLAHASPQRGDILVKKQRNSNKEELQLKSNHYCRYLQVKLYYEEFTWTKTSTSTRTLIIIDKCGCTQ